MILLRTDLEPKSDLRYYFGPVNDTNDIFSTFNPVTKRFGVSRDCYKFYDNMISIVFCNEVKLNNIDYILPKPVVQTAVEIKNIVSNTRSVNIPINIIQPAADPIVTDPINNNIERPKRTVIPYNLFKDCHCSNY